MANKKNDLVGTKVKAVPNEPQEIGIELKNELMSMGY